MKKSRKIIVSSILMAMLFSACSNKGAEDNNSNDISNNKVSSEESSNKKENSNNKEAFLINDLEDGTYKGKSQGYDGELEVEVSVADGKISDVKLLDNNETDAVVERAMPIIKKRMVESESLNFDAVSAATYTSNGVKKASKEALKEAGLSEDYEVNLDGPQKLNGENEIEAKETDVLIIGAGPSGLSSAIEAKRAGVENVTLIEKLDILSGNGKFDMNFFDMPNSKAMEENGTKITKEEFKEKLSEGSWDSKERQDAWTEGAFELDSWLRDMDIDLQYNYPKEGGMNHMARDDEYAGNFLQHGLEKEAKDLGIEIITGTKAQDLIIEDGVAKGAKVVDRDNKYDINAKATVVATGGFSHNPDLLKEYAPGAENIETSNQMGATGDFVEIAKDNDLKLDHMDKLSVFPKILDPRRDLTGGDGNFIYVNESGQRFIDEASSGLDYANKILENKPVYYIYDQDSYDNFYRLKKHNDLGYHKSADSVKELADLIGVDEENLKESIESYNKAVKGEAEDPFREEAGEDTIDTDKKLYVAQIEAAIHMTKGGIVADENARVLDNDENIIEGLYASGEVTDTSGAYSSSVVFGRIAGENAAGYINK